MPSSPPGRALTTSRTLCIRASPQPSAEPPASAFCLISNPFCWQVARPDRNVRRSAMMPAVLPKRAHLLLVAALFATPPAMADRLANAVPGSVGFAADRLQRLSETLTAEIDKGTMPGVVLLIQRNDKVAYFEA